MPVLTIIITRGSQGVITNSLSHCCRRVAVVSEGVFVLIRLFLNSGNYCERQRREPLGVSWGKLHAPPENVEIQKPGNAISFSSLQVNISNSIKSKITGICSHNNNIFV